MLSGSRNSRGVCFELVRSEVAIRRCCGRIEAFVHYLTGGQSDPNAAGVADIDRMPAHNGPGGRCFQATHRGTAPTLWERLSGSPDSGGGVCADQLGRSRRPTPIGTNDFRSGRARTKSGTCSAQPTATVLLTCGTAAACCSSSTDWVPESKNWRRGHQPRPHGHCPANNRVISNGAGALLLSQRHFTMVPEAQI